MTDDSWYNTKKCEDITDAGSVAYNKWYCNRPFDNCPYEMGTKEYDAWHNGWSRERGIV